MKYSCCFRSAFTFALAALVNVSCCQANSRMSLNPTIVLVTGAFHVDSAVDILGGRLQEAGYNTRSLGLRTVGNSGLTPNDDATFLEKELLFPLIEQQGKDVVLYLHSYAGFPGSVAIHGLSKQERSAQGKKGGIVGLIYQSAFIPKEGDTLVKMIGGSYAPWQSPNVCAMFFFGLLSHPETFRADIQVEQHRAGRCDRS